MGTDDAALTGGERAGLERLRAEVASLRSQVRGTGTGAGPPPAAARAARQRRFLRLGLRTVLVLALVVAARAFLTGPSPTAVRTRQGLASAIAWLQGGAEQAGLRTGPVGTWVHANWRVLRIAAVTVAALALVFWGRPTGKVVLGLALALLAALAVIEFLGRPPPRAAALPSSRRERAGITRPG